MGYFLGRVSAVVGAIVCVGFVAAIFGAIGLAVYGELGRYGFVSADDLELGYQDDNPAISKNIVEIGITLDEPVDGGLDIPLIGPNRVRRLVWVI